MAESLKLIPGSALSTRALGQLLPDSINPRNRMRKAKRFLLVAGRPMDERYAHWVTFFDEPDKGNLYSPAMRASINGHRPGDWMRAFFEEAKSLSPVDAAMSADVQSYLPYDLLVKVDITSMANSLEARSPLLDHEVMEFAARLPVDFKLRGRESKYLLKRAFSDLLPKPNVDRPKMGFAVPIGEWFRGPLRPLLEDALLSEQSARRGYFQHAWIRRLVSDHLDFRADHGFKLWNLMLLELWHREFLDGGSAAHASLD
jgi:asparagine synthase (glutamine-hydrolysing)